MDQIMTAAGMTFTQAMVGIQADVLLLYGALFVILMICTGGGLIVYAMRRNASMLDDADSTGAGSGAGLKESDGLVQMDMSMGSEFNRPGGTADNPMSRPKWKL